MKEYPIDIRTPEFKEEIDNTLNHLKIAGFYLKNPGRLLDKLEVAALEGFLLKQGFGNYEKYPGVAYKTTANIFSVWSNFKVSTLPHTLIFIIVFFAGFFLVLALEYIRNKDIQMRLLLEIMAFISLTGIMQFVMPIIGDGEADLSKHLFLFNVCFDLMFTAVVIYSLYRMWNFFRIFSARLQVSK